jgi:peptide/nickel transport system substrate-binding protein
MNEIKTKTAQFLRNFFIFSLFCLIFLLFNTCAFDKKDGQKEESLLTVLASPAEILSPSWGMQSWRLVWDGAFEGGFDNPLRPQLAESWEHTPDELEWTIRLRRDVLWHDGRPMTTRDVEFSIELINNPAAAHYSYDIVESLAVKDEHTFVVRFKRPPASWDWPAYYPEHLCTQLDPQKFFEWEFWKSPVGSGPYRFVRLVDQTIVELEANPDYYGTKPRIDKVRFTIGGEPLVELLSGNVDLIKANPGHILKVKKDPRFKVHHMVRTNAYLGMILNHKAEIFKDASIRRAILLAVNRRELHRVVNFPENLPIFDGPFTPDQFWNDDLPDPIPYDPELARELLGEAGWMDSDGDGFREKNERPCSFTVLTAGRNEAAVYIQELLKRIGVKMEISTMDYSVLQARLRAENFDAILARLWNRSEGNWSYKQLFGKNGLSGYQNPEVIRLLEQIDEQTRRDDRGSIFTRLNEIFQEDIPLLMLYSSVKSFISNTRVQGIESVLRLDPLGQIPKLWIADDGK